MMNDNLISVIVPIYKVENYLKQCIDSIINQTYKNLEIILVDDGSPDNCGKICDEYAKQDIRIKVLHKMNEGVSSARNSGINYATGEYIMFIDSDDWIDLNMVELFISIAIKNKCDMVIGSCEQFNKNFNRTVKCFPADIYTVTEYINYYATKLLNGFFNSPCCRLIKSDIVKKNSFPIDIDISEDLVFNVNVLCDSKKIVSIGNSAVYHYRMRKSSAVNTKVTNTKIFERIRSVLETANGSNNASVDMIIRHQYYLSNLMLTLKAINRGENKQYLTLKDVLFGITKMPCLNSKLNVFILYFFPFLYNKLKKLTKVDEGLYYE